MATGVAISLVIRASVFGYSTHIKMNMDICVGYGIYSAYDHVFGDLFGTRDSANSNIQQMRQMI